MLTKWSHIFIWLKWGGVWPSVLQTAFKERCVHRIFQVKYNSEKSARNWTHGTEAGGSSPIMQIAFAACIRIRYMMMMMFQFCCSSGCRKINRSRRDGMTWQPSRDVWGNVYMMLTLTGSSSDQLGKVISTCTYCMAADLTSQQKEFHG